MSLWVIIPVKPLGRAKSRLSVVLSPEERRDLAEKLLRRVLGVVREVPSIAGSLVISRDSKALSIAREYGAYTVQESGAPELNNALMRATQVVASWNGGAVLILPADLPLVTSEDIVAMHEMGRTGPTVVIATDQHHDGTNAMLVRPPGLVPYLYGPGSFERHKMAAAMADADVKVYESHRLELDIDLPEDLQIYQEFVRDNDEISMPIVISHKAT